MTTLKKYVFDIRDFDNVHVCDLTFELQTPCSYKDAIQKMKDFLSVHLDESASSIEILARDLIDGITNRIKFPQGRFIWLKSPAASQLPYRVAYIYYRAGELADAKLLIERVGNLYDAHEIIRNNVCDASYYGHGSYYRYNGSGIDIVVDGKYKPYYGDVDSNTLTHIDGIKKAIKLVEADARGNDDE